MSLVKQRNKLLEVYSLHRCLGSENWINFAMGEYNLMICIILQIEELYAIGLYC